MKTDNELKKQILHREDYTDYEWFMLMREHGECLPSEFCDIFDRYGEFTEEYQDIMDVDIYVLK